MNKRTEASGSKGGGMLTHVHSSIFDSPAQTLVNTVNVVGVMGRGVAKGFKLRYPDMFEEYRDLCRAGKFRIGDLHLWKSDTRWVLNFPTKTTWKKPSRMEYVEAGLETFVKSYKDLGITSASFPPLGCGNGNLDWNEVCPLMIRYLQGVSIPIYIHDVQVSHDFIPEHKEHRNAPSDFGEFLSDLRRCLYENKASYETMEGKSRFDVVFLKDNTLRVQHASGKREHISPDEIEAAWLRLRESILSIDWYSDEKSRRYKSYLFPILKELPYVRTVPIRRHGQPSSTKSHGLFIDRDRVAPYRETTGAEERTEAWLFP